MNLGILNRGSKPKGIFSGFQGKSPVGDLTVSPKPEAKKC